jgi:hypothetical protein
MARRAGLSFSVKARKKSRTCVNVRLCHGICSSDLKSMCRAKNLYASGVSRVNSHSSSVVVSPWVYASKNRRAPPGVRGSGGGLLIT